MKLLKKCEGLLYLGLLIAAAFYILYPKAQTIFNNHQRTGNAYQRIASQKAQLAKPQQPSDLLKYRLFAMPENKEASAQTTTNKIQSKILNAVRNSKARLIDFRENNITDNKLTFTLEAEGDIQALLEIIEKLGTLEYPILIDSMRARPLSSTGRKDKQMRLSTDLHIWRHS